MLHRGEASKAVSKMISGAPLLNFHHDPFVLLLLSNVSQSHFCSRPEAQDKHLSGMPTADYARWRLEGRALEHGFARAPGSAIRMVSDAGRWEVVHDQGIRTRMNAVARQVRAGMEAAGVRILGADCPCVVSATGEKPTRSVDLRVKVGDLYGVVEVKWSRSDLDAACRSAGKSVSWMKKAVAAPGHFLMGGRKYPIQGQLVGTLGGDIWVAVGVAVCEDWGHREESQGRGHDLILRGNKKEAAISQRRFEEEEIRGQGEAEREAVAKIREGQSPEVESHGRLLGIGEGEGGPKASSSQTMNVVMPSGSLGYF